MYVKLVEKKASLIHFDVAHGTVQRFRQEIIIQIEKNVQVHEVPGTLYNAVKTVKNYRYRLNKWFDAQNLQIAPQTITSNFISRGPHIFIGCRYSPPAKYPV